MLSQQKQPYVLSLLSTTGCTHFYDQATGEVEESHNPAPIEYPIREYLTGHTQENLLRGNKLWIVDHAAEQSKVRTTTMKDNNTNVGKPLSIKERVVLL